MATDVQDGQLGNQWIKLFPAGTHDGETYSRADLDKIIAEYGGRAEGDKAPVGLGSSSAADQESFGRIDSLRRVGDFLEGKFVDVDPRIEHLYGRGVFPKKSIQMNRSPGGATLQRVGLIAPKFYDSVNHDNATPSLDELMAQNTGTKDYTFKEIKVGKTSNCMVSIPFEMREFHGEKAIERLKDRGYWVDSFDRLNFPAMFSELQPPVLDQLVLCIEGIMREGDPTSTLLRDRAQYRARSRNLSFGEALTQVSRSRASYAESPADKARNRDMEAETSQKALESGLLTQEIYDLAWKYANSEG